VPVPVPVPVPIPIPIPIPVPVPTPIVIPVPVPLILPLPPPPSPPPPPPLLGIVTILPPLRRCLIWLRPKVHPILIFVLQDRLREDSASGRDNLLALTRRLHDKRIRPRALVALLS